MFGKTIVVFIFRSYVFRLTRSVAAFELRWLCVLHKLLLCLLPRNCASLAGISILFLNEYLELYLQLAFGSETPIRTYLRRKINLMWFVEHARLILSRQVVVLLLARICERSFHLVDWCWEMLMNSRGVRVSRECEIFVHDLRAIYTTS